MYYSVMEFPMAVRIGILIMGFIVLCTGLYVFPLQARFANPIRMTIRNAFMASLSQFPRTLLMILLLFLGPAMILISGRLAPIVFFFGISVHAYLSAKLYNKFFERLEARNPQAASQSQIDETDERIFHDRTDSEETEKQK